MGMKPMKLPARMFLLFLTAFVLVTAARAEHSGTDIAYPVAGGNLYFDKASGTVTDCEQSVTEAVIPSQIDGVSVASIGWRAFYNCSGLTNVEIPDSVTSIGECAFLACDNLTSIEMPKSVVSIGAGAFSYCHNLTNIKVESNSNYYSSLNGVLFSKNLTIIANYPAGRTEGFYRIPDSVDSIRYDAFAGCDNLISVEIPNGVASIGRSAFADCHNLTNVKIASNVKFIDEGAFYGCSNLRDVYYDGTKAQWEEIENIEYSELISDDITIHYADFAITSAPTVNGHAIGKADLSGLTEITVPLSVSADTPAQITLCVPFYDGNGKFVGMGMATQTVSKNTTSAAVPVAGDMSGAAKLGVAILGADSRPLSAYSCPIS